MENLKMSYRIEGAYSPYKYLQIELTGTGEGKLTYELYREYVAKDQEKQRTVIFSVDNSTLQEFLRLYEGVDFFNLEVIDLNKEKIQVTDVGTTTLMLNYQGKKRELFYGYVKDNPLEELVRLYWQVIRGYLPQSEILRII